MIDMGGRVSSQSKKTKLIIVELIIAGVQFFLSNLFATLTKSLIPRTNHDKT